MQEALELYRNDCDDFDLYKDTVLHPWQQELLEKINEKSDRQVFWIVGKRPMKANHTFRNMSKRCMERIELLLG